MYASGFTSGMAQQQQRTIQIDLPSCVRDVDRQAAAEANTDDGPASSTHTGTTAVPLPTMEQLATHAANTGPRLRQLQATHAREGVTEAYSMEHVHRLLTWEARTPWTGSKCSVYCNQQHVQPCHACTTCHFCRQKTVDKKTTCSRCGRGHWCAACLYERAGQHIEHVVNPDGSMRAGWICPVCLDLCNCSAVSCLRAQRGWRPTGQLYSEARDRGYMSVAHYLVLTQVHGSMGAAPLPTGTAAALDPFARCAVARMSRERINQSTRRRIAVTRDHALQQLVNRMMQKLQVPMLPTLAPGGGGGGTAGGLLQGGALQVGATHAGQGAVGRGTVGPLDEQEEEEEEQGQQRVGGREGNVGMREGGVIGQRTRQGTTRLLAAAGVSLPAHRAPCIPPTTPAHPHHQQHHANEAPVVGLVEGLQGEMLHTTRHAGLPGGGGGGIPPASGAPTSAPPLPLPHIRLYPPPTTHTTTAHTTTTATITMTSEASSHTFHHAPHVTHPPTTSSNIALPTNNNTNIIPAAPQVQGPPQPAAPQPGTIATTVAAPGGIVGEGGANVVGGGGGIVSGGGIVGGGIPQQAYGGLGQHLLLRAQAQVAAAAALGRVMGDAGQQGVLQEAAQHACRDILATYQHAVPTRFAVLADGAARLAAAPSTHEYGVGQVNRHMLHVDDWHAVVCSFVHIASVCGLEEVEGGVCRILLGLEECSLDPSTSHLEALASLQHALQCLLSHYAHPPLHRRPTATHLLTAMADLVSVLQNQVDSMLKQVQDLPLVVGDVYDVGPLRVGPVGGVEDVAAMVGEVLAYTEGCRALQGVGLQYLQQQLVNGTVYADMVASLVVSHPAVLQLLDTSRLVSPPLRAMTISTIQLALLLLLQNTRSGGHAGGQERAPGGQGGQQGGQQGAQQGGQVAVTAHQLKEVLLPVCENMVQLDFPYRNPLAPTTPGVDKTSWSAVQRSDKVDTLALLHCLLYRMKTIGWGDVLQAAGRPYGGEGVWRGGGVLARSFAGYFVAAVVTMLPEALDNPTSIPSILRAWMCTLLEDGRVGAAVASQLTEALVNSTHPALHAVMEGVRRMEAAHTSSRVALLSALATGLHAPPAAAAARTTTTQLVQEVLSGLVGAVELRRRELMAREAERTSAPIHSTTTPDTLSLAAFRFEVNAFDTLAAVAAPLATRTGALGSLVVPLVHACGEGLCRIMRHCCVQNAHQAQQHHGQLGVHDHKTLIATRVATMLRLLAACGVPSRWYDTATRLGTRPPANPPPPAVDPTRPLLKTLRLLSAVLVEAAGGVQVEHVGAYGVGGGSGGHSGGGVGGVHGAHGLHGVHGVSTQQQQQTALCGMSVVVDAVAEVVAGVGVYEAVLPVVHLFLSTFITYHLERAHHAGCQHHAAVCMHLLCVSLRRATGSANTTTATPLHSTTTTTPSIVMGTLLPPLVLPWLALMQRPPTPAVVPYEALRWLFELLARVVQRTARQGAPLLWHPSVSREGPSSSSGAQHNPQPPPPPVRVLITGQVLPLSLVQGVLQVLWPVVATAAVLVVAEVAGGAGGEGEHVVTLQQQLAERIPAARTTLLHHWLGPPQDLALVKEVNSQHVAAARPLGHAPPQHVPLQQQQWEAAVAGLQMLLAMSTHDAGWPYIQDLLPLVATLDMTHCTHTVLHWTAIFTACAARAAEKHGHQDTAERLQGAAQRAAGRLEELKGGRPRGTHTVTHTRHAGEGPVHGGSSTGVMNAKGGTTAVPTTTTNAPLRPVPPPQQHQQQPAPLKWTRLREAAMLPVQSKVSVVGMVNMQQGRGGIVERTTARGKTLWTVDLTDPDSPGWSMRAVFDGKAPDAVDCAKGTGGERQVVGITNALVFKTENQRVMLRTSKESTLESNPRGGVVEAVARAEAAVRRARGAL